jgi:hypothetical protein
MPIGAKLRPNDYITGKKQFAIEHAITSSIYHGEDYGVYRFFLNDDEFREADNPGEYRYAGLEKEVPLYGIADYDIFSSNSVFKRSKDRLKNLYSWLNNNGFTKESKELEALIIKKSSGPLFDAEYMFDDQAYPYYGESEYFINGFNKEAQEISDIDTFQVLEGHRKHLPELLEDRYRVTRQEWGDGTRTTYSYSPKTGENWKEDFETRKDPNSDWSEKKPFSYNPEIVESYETTEDKWGTTKKPILREGWSYDIPKNEEYMYRGMSWEEYQSILEDGFIKSMGDYNIGDAQMGLTYFTSTPRSAQSYADGFAPPLYRSSIGRPAVVIAVPKRVGIKVPGTAEDEIGIKETIKRGEIKEVWLGRIFEISRDGSIDIINDAFGQRRGTSSVPSTQMAWKKQN